MLEEKRRADDAVRALEDLKQQRSATAQDFAQVDHRVLSFLVSLLVCCLFVL